MGTCTGYIDKSPDVIIRGTVLHRINIKEAQRGSKGLFLPTPSLIIRIS